MTRRQVALIGAGQMGASHARVIAESTRAELAVVVDIDAVAAERLARTYGCRFSADLADALQCDAAVVAGSTASRMACVPSLLRAGMPSLVEKPFAPSLAELDQLLELATAGDVPVMCGFVERFNAAFCTAVQNLDGPAVHLLAVRHSPPAPRIASSVVNDLMLHDLDVAQRLFGRAEAVLAGSAFVQPAGSAWKEIADCTITFGLDGLATLSANRMGQRKVRSLSISTATQLIEVDMLRQDVTVFRNVSQEMMLSSGGMGYRSSTEVELPFVRHAGEPLALQFAHFLQLIDGVTDREEERQQIRPAHALAELIEHPSPH